MAVNEKLGKDPGSAARRRNRGTTHPWRRPGETFATETLGKSELQIDLDLMPMLDQRNTATPVY